MNVYENIMKVATPQGRRVFNIEQQCNLSNGTLKSWATREPGAFKLKKVADMLGVTIDSLLSDSPVEYVSKRETATQENNTNERADSISVLSNDEVFHNAIEAVLKLQERNIQLQRELDETNRKIAACADEK